MRGWPAQARRYLGLLLSEIRAPSPPRGLLSSVKGGIYDGIFKGMPRQGCPFLWLCHLLVRNTSVRTEWQRLTGKTSICLSLSVPADQGAGLSYLLLCVCLFAPPGKAGLLLPLRCSFPRSTSWHRSVSPWHGSAIHAYLSQSVHHR